MPRVGAIHDTLRHIDARARDIQHIVYIGDAVDRTAMNSHSELDMWMTLQRLADFQRASRRLFRAAEKNQRHPVSCGQPNELATCFGRPKTLSAADELIQL